MKGKCEAFTSFADILGNEMTKAIPELKDDVSKILAGRPVDDGIKGNDASAVP